MHHDIALERAPAAPWKNAHPEAVALFERRRTEMARARRGSTLGLAGLFVLALAGSLVAGEVDLDKLARGLPGIFSYIRDIAPVLRPGHLGHDLAAWYWALPRWLGLLADTAGIAYLGTLLGAGLALALCFPASANLTPNRAALFAAKRAMEIARSVPDLVFALIFVFAFGLGPLPGVLALALHSAGALCKLFAEVNENVDMGPVDGLRASGAGWVQTMRYAVLPQVLPNYLSYALLRFEINVRAATVVGFVGAGGIGQELMLVVRQFIYPDISALVLLLLAVVFVFDIGCERLRRMVIEGEQAGFSLPSQARNVLLAGFVLLTLVCLGRMGFFNLPNLWTGLGKLVRIVSLMWPPDSGGYLGQMLGAMAETLAMAFLGTLCATLAALPLGFLGAANVTRARLPRFFLRRLFDVLRGVDPLIWALVVINVVGLGPFAGIMAIAISDSGVLAKLFAEAVENVDPKQIDGVRASGASPLQVVRYGYLPQVTPVLLSSTLYYFESNTRSASILGVVGAGGIGMQLADRIRINAWDQVLFIVLLILAAIYAIDTLSRAIRLRCIGQKEILP
ncbi:phosphonate ABC transporter, permease protein PhnE [Fundidesulfovibrio butyratiphilus]